MLGLDNPIHILFLLIILLLVFGAKRLPEMGKSLGEGLRGFKDSISGETPVSHMTADEPAAAPQQLPTAPAQQFPTAPAQQLPTAPVEQLPTADVEQLPTVPAIPFQAPAARGDEHQVRSDRGSMSPAA